MKLTTSQRSALTRLEFEYGGQCRAMDIGLVGEDLNELAWGKMIENIGSNVFGHPIWRISEAGRNAMKEGR